MTVGVYIYFVITKFDNHATQTTRNYNLVNDATVFIKNGPYLLFLMFLWMFQKNKVHYSSMC